MAAEGLLQRQADLAHRRLGPRRLHRQGQEIGPAAGALRQGPERALNFSIIAF